MSTQQKRETSSKTRSIILEDPLLFKSVRIEVIPTCVFGKEAMTSSWACPRWALTYGAILHHPKATNTVPRGAVDYLSKWAEAIAFPTNDARVVCKFLKSLIAKILCCLVES
ncbi:hypothetical protein Tco_0755439 [Tanacetum coccineum]